MQPERVLFCYRDDVDVHGGAATVMAETAAALATLGVEVDVTYEAEPDVTGYDLVHAFNAWKPSTALGQLRHLRGSGVPVVWLPFYLHWHETAWAIPAVRRALDPARPADEQDALLAELAAGTLEVDGRGRFLPNEIEPGFHADLAEMLRCVDHVCAISTHEVRTLFQTAGVTTKPFTLTPHGVDPSFATASPDPWRDRFGADPFVLCVGALDARKNQALLAEAVRGIGVRLVLVGPAFEPDYRDLCLARGNHVTHVERLPRELVASGYRAAAVHALPSFAEGAALASLEAAAAGAPLVVSNRSSEVEYFGDLPYYCDPVDPASIRRAVLLALESGPDQPARWESLAARALAHTWRRTAEATLEAYRRTLAGDRRGEDLRPVGGRFTALAHADELLEHPELLDAYREAVSGVGDAELVIYAPGADPDALAEELGPLVEAAGLAGENGPELVAVAVPRDDANETAIARAVDAVYSRRVQSGAFRVPPRLHDGTIAGHAALKRG